MNLKYTALFLVLLVAASGASNVNLLQDFTFKQLDSGEISEDGLTANVNDYIDKTLALVGPFIQQNEMDPMPLPNVREGFQVRPLWVTLSAWLTLHSGRMYGLSNVARYGDQKVSYSGKNLSVRIQLEFTDIAFVYRYLAEVLSMGPTGGARGFLNRFVIVLDVLLDFNVNEIHLQDFSLNNIGHLHIQLYGNSLIDWLVNPVVNLIVRIINSTLINSVQYNIRNVIQNTIAGINTDLRHTIERLESYNNA